MMSVVHSRIVMLLQLLTVIALAIRYACGDNISRDHDFEWISTLTYYSLHQPRLVYSFRSCSDCDPSEPEN